MKRMLAFLMAVLLLAAALHGVAEEWEDTCSPTLEDQLVEMSAWIQEAIKARSEEDYAREAFLLQRITGYSTELFPDEVAWAWAELGDLYLEGLYQIEDEEDVNSGKTAEELAAVCYEQARKVYDENPEIGRRDDERHLILQTKLALKLGKLYASPEMGLMDYEKAVSQLDFAARLSWTEEESAEAHYWLGLIYLDADSGRMDEREARNELYQAAHAGHEAAFQKLKELIGDDAWEWAQYYLWDNDFDAAVQVLLPAAEQGNVECMKRLASLYYSGLVGNPAALYDDAVRENNRNRELACYWFEKAADAGDEEALEWLEEIGTEGRNE